MDPIGLVSFLIDTTERIRNLRDAAHKTRQAVRSSSHEVTTSLEDLEDIMLEVRRHATDTHAPPPDDLQQDLAKLKSKLEHYMGFLSDIYPCEKSSSFAARMWQKGQSYWSQNRRYDAIKQMDAELANTLQRFSSKWNGLNYMDSVNRNHILSEHREETQSAFSSLQQMLENLTVDMKRLKTKAAEMEEGAEIENTTVASPKELDESTIAHATKDYLARRLDRLGKETLLQLQRKQPRPCSEANTRPVHHFAVSPKLQEQLDSIIDSISSATQAVQDAHCAFHAALRLIYRVLQRLSCSFFLEEALSLGQGLVRLCLAKSFESDETYDHHAWALATLAVQQIALGLWKDAEQSSEQSIAILRQIAKSHPLALNRTQLATVLYNHSLASFHLRGCASPYLDQSISLWRTLLCEGGISFQGDLCDTLLLKARCLWELGQVDESLELFKETVRIVKSSEAPNVDSRWRLITVLRQLADYQVLAGQFEEALSCCSEALGMWTEDLNGSFTIANKRLELAMLLDTSARARVDMSDLSEALRDSNQSSQLVREACVPEPNPLATLGLCKCLDTLANIHRLMNQKPEALEASREAFGLSEEHWGAGFVSNSFTAWLDIIPFCPALTLSLCSGPTTDGTIVLDAALQRLTAAPPTSVSDFYLARAWLTKGAFLVSNGSTEAALELTQRCIQLCEHRMAWLPVKAQTLLSEAQLLRIALHT